MTEAGVTAKILPVKGNVKHITEGTTCLHAVPP